MANGSGIHPVVRVPLAGLLAWLVPGVGHIFIGQRVRGIIFLITITLTFWTGVAIGGVRDTVDPHARKAWFTAQACTGVHALVAHSWASKLRETSRQQGQFVPQGHWLSVETGVVYAGVAGLLNLLVILDALTRADVPEPNRSANPPVQRRGAT